MEVLTTIEAGGQTIDFGVATTRTERQAVLAQRFRVYRREGYYKEGVREDRDEYDRGAVYFLGRLRGASATTSLLVGSARLIPGKEDPGFRFPCQRVLRFELPRVVQDTPVNRRAEVGRFVSERPRGVIPGKLATVLGLFEAIAEYSDRHDLRCGFASIKRRSLRALGASGLPFHRIRDHGLIYPRDGIISPYFYSYPDPVVLVYWFAEEVAPIVRKVLEVRHRIYNDSRPSGDPPVPWITT